MDLDTLIITPIPPPDTLHKLPIYFKINKKDFFKPIERKDVFDEIIIIRKNAEEGDNGNSYKFIYSSFPGDIDVKNLDSIMATNEGLSSGILRDIELSGIEYILFIKQIKLLNGDLYYVGGVINKENLIKLFFKNIQLPLSS